MFIGARKLANGGIVFHLESTEAARWIQQNKEAFIRKFSVEAVVKEHTFSVLVEYVPIRHAPEAMGENRKIERDSQIPLNTLVSTRWVKPPQKRAPGQPTAHLIAKFTSTEVVNLSIKNGLIIAGKRTWARRLRREPRRCLKCQDLNACHLVATCVKDDICGTCGQKHRTSECTETDPELFACADCSEYGNASWDRTCPKFLELCNQLEANDPESTYKYFIDEQKWTWEQCGGGTNKSNLRVEEDRTTQTNERETQQIDENDRFDTWSEMPYMQTQDPRPRTQRHSGANPRAGNRDTGWQRPSSRQSTIDEHFGRELTREYAQQSQPNTCTSQQ